MTFLKKKLLNYLTNKLLHSISEEDILSLVKTSNGQGYYLLGGKKISKQQLTHLKQDAAIIKEMEMWKILNATLTANAHKMMFINSKSFEDVISGKLMLYNLDVQNKIINTLSQINLQ